MRQYKLFYKRQGAKEFSKLEPHVHAPLYDRPAVAAGIKAMAAVPEMEGGAIRIADELFNVISFEAPEPQADAFPFESEDVIVINEPIDNQAVLAEAMG